MNIVTFICFLLLFLSNCKSISLGMACSRFLFVLSLIYVRVARCVCGSALVTI